MIPKAPHDSHNPNNYRPISLTNTVAKILEKLIKYRLVYYLEINNIILKEQSGFRSKKRAIDNVFYFKQKCLEAFAMRKKKKNRVGGIIFDIEKAFDKVWLEGLLYKMHQMKIPTKLAKWIMNFIQNRKFYVSVNGKDSKLYDILTGVPQGAILSPILFLIFINDILMSVPNYEHISRSLLFADDLFRFFFDHCLKRLKLILQKYLNELEVWLSKWRLKISANKCSYNIYTEFNECKDKLDLKIFGKNIPKQDNPKYLGIHLDHNLNFKHHIQELKNKCLRKLNFIKILKSKKWHAKIETKTRIYKSMIRSNIDFAGPLLENVAPVDKQQLESIQYHSMVQILNAPPMSSSTEMRKKLQLDKITSRTNALKQNYLTESLSKNKIMKDLKTEHQQFKLNYNITDNKYSMFNIECSP